MKNLTATIILTFSLNILFANSTKNDLGHIFEKPDKSYGYVDGNGNKYLITQAKTGYTIQYFPMTKEMSSSGEYQGGEGYKIAIPENEYKELIDLLNKSTKDIKQQNVERNMGSGTIILPRNRIYYLKMDSYNKTAIEIKLKELKDKYMTKNDPPKLDTVIIEGIFVEKNFVSKKGEMKDIKEFYFVPTVYEIENNKLAKEYFVKLSKGKVTREQIKEFMGRTIRARLVLLKGLWDADDNTHQSRFGDYVIVFDLID